MKTPKLKEKEINLVKEWFISLRTPLPTVGVGVRRLVPKYIVSGWFGVDRASIRSDEVRAS
jgi:hypothetical protein